MNRKTLQSVAVLSVLCLLAFSVCSLWLNHFHDTLEQSALKGAAYADIPTFPYVKAFNTDITTGTTQFLTVKVSSGNAVVMSTTDVNGYSGVCVANCGIATGTSLIAFAGVVPVIGDG